MTEEKDQTLTRVDGECLPEGPRTAAENKPTRIKNGIEFFTIAGEEDCQCARCGSSTYWVDCANCGGEGEIEDEDWQFEGEYSRCNWCRGTGGWFRCLSSKAWCEANPMPGRENQPVMGIAPNEVLD